MRRLWTQEGLDFTCLKAMSNVQTIRSLIGAPAVTRLLNIELSPEFLRNSQEIKTVNLKAWR